MKTSEFPGSCAAIIIHEIEGTKRDVQAYLESKIERFSLAPFIFLILDENQERKYGEIVSNLGFEEYDRRVNYNLNCSLFIYPSKSNRP